MTMGRRPLPGPDDARGPRQAAGGTDTGPGGSTSVPNSRETVEKGSVPMHVDAETLAAWADGGLTPDAAREVETHLSSCAPCQAMAAAFARAAPESPAALALQPAPAVLVTPVAQSAASPTAEPASPAAPLAPATPPASPTPAGAPAIVVPLTPRRAWRAPRWVVPAMGAAAAAALIWTLLPRRAPTADQVGTSAALRTSSSPAEAQPPPPPPPGVPVAPPSPGAEAAAEAARAAGIGSDAGAVSAADRAAEPAAPRPAPQARQAARAPQSQTAAADGGTGRPTDPTGRAAQKDAPTTPRVGGAADGNVMMDGISVMDTGPAAAPASEAGQSSGAQMTAIPAGEAKSAASAPARPAAPPLPGAPASPPTPATAAAAAQQSPTEIQVKSEAPAIQAASGERSFTVQTVDVQNLPMAARGFRDVVAGTPADVVAEFTSTVVVTSSPPSGGGGAGRVTGGQGGAAAGGRGGAPAVAGAGRTANGGAGTNTSTPSAVVHWRVLATGAVQRSATDSAPWTTVPLPAGVVITGGAAASPAICWLVGTRGAIFLMTDGQNFRRVTSPTSENITSVLATSARQATITTSDGNTFITADGGASWQ